MDLRFLKKRRLHIVLVGLLVVLGVGEVMAVDRPGRYGKV
jgi:hypothetical protein